MRGRQPILLGEPLYARVHFPATPKQKALLACLEPRDVPVTVHAGDAIRAALTTASWDHQPIGGIKVVTDQAWFAERPSGTEAVLKIYAESFKDLAHLHRIQEEAYAIIQTAVATKAQALADRSSSAAAGRGVAHGARPGSALNVEPHYR